MTVRELSTTNQFADFQAAGLPERTSPSHPALCEFGPSQLARQSRTLDALSSGDGTMLSPLPPLFDGCVLTSGTRTPTRPASPQAAWGSCG